MKSTHKILVFSFFLMPSKMVVGQNLFTTEPLIIRNSQAYRETYKDIQGSPFLMDYWSKGSVTTKEAVITDLNMMYNEVNDQLLFKVKEGDNEKLLDLIKEFTIVDKDRGNVKRKFLAGFAPTKYSNDKTFFESLTVGKAKLLKKNSKIISENKEYSGKTARTVVANTNYYIALEDNVPVKIALNEKSIAQLLDFKGPDINQYIKSNQLNLKQEEDLIKLINYYNTL